MGSASPGLFQRLALWTYLTTPFLLTMPGFAVSEIAPWREGEETWRGLRATFPPNVASHSTEQDFYFGADFLRGATTIMSTSREASQPLNMSSTCLRHRGGGRDTRAPKRRAYLRDDHLQPIRERVMVAIDLSDIRFQ